MRIYAEGTEFEVPDNHPLFTSGAEYWAINVCGSEEDIMKMFLSYEWLAKCCRPKQPALIGLQTLAEQVNGFGRGVMEDYVSGSYRGNLRAVDAEVVYCIHGTRFMYCVRRDYDTFAIGEALVSSSERASWSVRDILRYKCGLLQCQGCDVILPDGGAENPSDYVLCGHCANNLEQCEVCGEYELPRCVSTVYDSDCRRRALCDSCFNRVEHFYCTYHGCYEVGAERFWVGGEAVCERAYDEASVCRRCDELFFPNEDCDGGDRFCPACREDMSTQERLEYGLEVGAFSYGYKPEPRFFSGRGSWCDYPSRGDLYLGLELEMGGGYSGCEDEAANTIHAEMGEYLYCKHDSSITRGIETVTHPLEAGFAFGYNWERLYDLAGEHDLGAHPSCGLHFHLSKSFFSMPKLASAKLIRIFDRFYELWLPVCNRDYDDALSWAKPSNIGPVNIPWEELHDALISCKDSRYHAVNIMNRDTIEIRLFGSQEDGAAVRRCVDIVQALAHLAEEKGKEYFDTVKWDELICDLCDRAMDADEMLKAFE